MPPIRVIVLRGAGTRAFSAGADISEFDSARSGDAAKAYDALNDAAFAAAQQLLQADHRHDPRLLPRRRPSASRCAADIRLADDKAEFAIPAAKLGLGYNARWVRPLFAGRAPGPRQGNAVHRPPLQS